MAWRALGKAWLSWLRVDQAEHENISGILRGLLIRLDDRLAARDTTLIAEFIGVGELGLALEQMADALSQDVRPISASERADMLALDDRMRMGDCVPRALRGCPDRMA
jgi:hypothetical protein